jgi:hypothetical protein
MKKVMLPFLICLSFYCFGQGLNNKYNIDNEDLVNVLKGQGINIFKYPFDVKKGEYISISYEIFEGGKQVLRKHILEDMQLDHGFNFNHHLARKDTTVFHRFYFFEKNDTLTVKPTLPGVQTTEKIDLSRIVTGSFNSRTKIPKDLTKKEEILFYYGNISEGLLSCSTGISKDDLIKRYDFVILFYAEKITKERTKTILQEVKNIKEQNNY